MRVIRKINPQSADIIKKQAPSFVPVTYFSRTALNRLGNHVMLCGAEISRLMATLLHYLVKYDPGGD